MSVRAGTRIAGRYLLVERIAVGGMGEVWRGTDEELGRPVAVKVLRAELAEDEAFRKRFRAEARTAARLPHNGIAAVFDYGETSVGPDGESPSRSPVQGDGIAYLVMELVPGEPLSAILQREGALGSQRTVNLLSQTAHALHSAHVRGVIHRDVKPANLMVTPEGRVKVTDFGIARPTDHEPLTMTGQVMGTAHYLAPELARGADASPLSDVYALGVVAYECLAGHRPFEGDNQVVVATAHINQQPPPLPGTVPPDVVRVVAAAMEKEPKNRIRSAEALAVALEKLAAHDPTALDGIGASGAGAHGARAPMFGPGGGVLDGGAPSTPPDPTDPTDTADPTVPWSGSVDPPGGRAPWTPQTTPQGQPAVQRPRYSAADPASGTGRFLPGDPSQPYPLGPAPGGRRRGLRGVFSPTLILMLALLALIIVLIIVLNQTSGSGGLVNVGDEPSPSSTPSFSESVTPSATSASTSASVSTTPSASPTSSRPTTPRSSPTPTGQPTPSASTTSPPSSTPPTSSTNTPPPSSDTSPPTQSVPEPTPTSTVASVPELTLSTLGGVGLWVPVGAVRRSRRRTGGRGGSGEAPAGPGSTMAITIEQGRNA